MEIWDDPTLFCDYISRCDNRLIKEFLKDLKTPLNIKSHRDRIRNKWQKIYKDNEEDDR